MEQAPISSATLMHAVPNLQVRILASYLGCVSDSASESAWL